MSSNKPVTLNTSGVLAELNSGNELDSTTVPYTIVSSNTTAVAGDKLALDSSSGTFIVTLPTAPVAGDVVRLKDYRRNLSITNVTVDPGSKRVEGFLGSFILDVEGIEADMEFINNTRGWLVRFKF